MSGSHRTSGGHQTGDGLPDPYPSVTHRRGSYAGGEFRAGQQSGGRRAESGNHRVSGGESRWGWRTALVLAGAMLGVCLCAAVVVMVMNRASGSGDASGAAKRGMVAQKETNSDGKKGTRIYTLVPDSCTTLTQQQAAALVTDFQQNPSPASDTDTYSECVWTDFAAGSGRQVLVELRVIGASGGRTADAVAHATFLGEQTGDNSGNGGIAAGQTIAAHDPLAGFGDEAYLTYSEDSSQGFGQTSINMRVSNLLVAVRFGGSDGNGPLAHQSADTGAKQAANDVLATLGSTIP